MKHTYLKYTNFYHTNITVLNLLMKKICKFELVFNLQKVFSVFLLHWNTLNPEFVLLDIVCYFMASCTVLYLHILLT